jgi:LacI family transcriptional regulator, galactose operon repressor
MIVAMRKKQQVTIYDIAERAKVSPATVSRVLHGSLSVSAQKRDAVLAAAVALKYRPNPMAQDLASGRSQTIGLLLPDTSSFWGRLIRGVEKGVREHGLHLLMATGEGSGGDREALDLLVAHHVDGIVIAGGGLADADVVALAAETPVVAINRSLVGREDCRMVVKNFEAAVVATRHLLELGHTRIAHIAGPLVHPDAADRRDGYLAALAEAGVPNDPGLLLEGDFMWRGGLVAMETLLSAGREFTAVFASTDQMALGAMLALYHRGLQVPGDISVLGFDDETFSAYCCPPLTTVSQPLFEMGQVAVRNIAARVNGQHFPLASFTASLLVRESTRRRPTATDLA